MEASATLIIRHLVDRTELSLTDAGRAVIGQRRRAIRAGLAARLAALSPEEQLVLELASRVASPIIDELMTATAAGEQTTAPRTPPAA